MSAYESGVSVSVEQIKKYMGQTKILKSKC